MKRRKLRHNQNPYLRLVESKMVTCRSCDGSGKMSRPFSGVSECWYCNGTGKHTDWQTNPTVKRGDVVREYAWAIPSEEAIECLVSMSPIVEMCAGSGYWAALVRDRGGDIVALDASPESWKFNWTQVDVGLPQDLRKYSDHTLLVCWPPYAEDVAERCAKSYRGNRIIYVGEPDGGCTGELKLSHHWLEVRHIKIPQWDGLHDSMTIYERKSAPIRKMGGFKV